MINKRESINLGMGEDPEEQWGEAESRWEMKSLSSVDDAILAKQNIASVLADSNKGYIAKIGTNGNIEQVGTQLKPIILMPF